MFSRNPGGFSTKKAVRTIPTVQAISACSVASESRPALRVLENVKSHTLQADLIHGRKCWEKTVSSPGKNPQNVGSRWWFQIFVFLKPLLGKNDPI